jgi:hypothetical protein
MKALLCGLIFATLGSATAKADSLTITLDRTNPTAFADDTLQFFGTITNDTDTTLFLNNDDLNIGGLSLTTTDQFFNTVPFTLAPEGQAGDSSGDIELFDMSVSDPLLDAAGVYAGTYTLFGGPNGNAQDNLGSTSFSVTTVSPVPEPSTLCLLLSGMLAMAAIAWRRLAVSVKFRVAASVITRCRSSTSV